MGALLRAIVRRDLLLAWRRRADVATVVLFFLIVVSLFPFGVGPEPNLLRTIAPGIIWVAALLAGMLSLQHMFASDHADGALDQMLLAAAPLGLIVIMRAFAHWLISGLPLVVLSPALALQFGLPSELSPLLMLSLLLGTPILTLIGAIGAALTLGLRGGGMLRHKVLLREAKLIPLRELLAARQRLGLSARLVELVEVDLGPYRHRLLLGGGQREGIEVDQAVIDALGLVGQISRSDIDRAEVILITDPGHAIPVRVVRNGLRAVAYGTGDLDRLELPHIPFSADIVEGDVLVTSGLGGHFPPGIPVAVVTGVKGDDSATFAIAEARPAAGLTHSNQVLVLRPDPPSTDPPATDPAAPARVASPEGPA